MSIDSAAAHARSTLGAELTEREAALRVFLAAGGLVVLGVALLIMTVWWWRNTRPEPPALAPLEVMSDKKWMSAGEAERRRIVEEYRPDGAVPMRDLVIAPEPIDLSELARDVPSFDDLLDVSLDSERRSALTTTDPEQLELAESVSGAASIPVLAEAKVDVDVDVDADQIGADGGAEVVATPVDGRTDPHDGEVHGDALGDSGDSAVEMAAAVGQLDSPATGAALMSAAEVISAIDAISAEVAGGSYDATVAQPRPGSLSEAAGRD